ncbi:hypothetical protein GF361_03225 [Candidatus Woesearchaeota archaeon]|nr:hypothetical protein [Candidatus Woesearchaeota archaeon]
MYLNLTKEELLRMNISDELGKIKRLSKKKRKELQKIIRKKRKALEEELEKVTEENEHSKYWIRQSLDTIYHMNLIDEAVISYGKEKFPINVFFYLKKRHNSDKLDEGLVARIKGNVPEEKKEKIRTKAESYSSRITELYNSGIDSVFFDKN